jgi:hypothetical protein
MSLNDKLAANADETILAEAETEISELSEHARPMVIGVINEA